MVHEDKARKEFASRLALACENAGYEQHGRQAEIARRMKLTPKAVSKWFNGETIPRREKLRELATLIGTTPTYLLGEDTEESGQVRFRVCASLYPISFFYTQDVLKVLYINEHKVHYIPTNPPRPTERRAILRVTRQWSGVK